MNASPVRATPTLSVVIPHLNEPAALRRCLTALEAQRRDGVDFEIIVADNGSTQSPAPICALFSGTRLVVETTPGPGPARNRGAALARGNIMAFIDADCVAQPGWVRAISDYFALNPRTDFIGGSIGVLRAGDRFTAVEAYEAVFSYRTAMLVQRQRFAPTGNMAVRRAGFLSVGPFAGIARHEDRVWGHKAVSMGLKLNYVPAARVLTGGSAGFRALARRTDIHVAHDFADLPPGLGARVRWAILALVIAASSLLQLATVMRSSELSGLRERLGAARCLIGIRLYRAWRMIALLFHDWSGRQLDGWNRSEPVDEPLER
jgi:glycosyltransferase involved in cell wall biosynthesis